MAVCIPNARPEGQPSGEVVGGEGDIHRRSARVFVVGPGYKPVVSPNVRCLQAIRDKKLNTTSYHPACDGLVERFNRTLKTALRKHAATHGDQWDRYLSGVLWAYRNVPYDSTGEKPSFLLFGTNLRSPTEAALLPVIPVAPTDVEDYREELVCSLATARNNAAESIRGAQRRYKKYHDQHATPYNYRVGSWAFVRLPQLEMGKKCKPWHGPYRVVSVTNPDVCVVKVYFPEDGEIRIHQSRVKPCPVGFPAGAYLYKGLVSPGNVPRWVQKHLNDCTVSPDAESFEGNLPPAALNIDADKEPPFDEGDPSAVLPSRVNGFPASGRVEPGVPRDAVDRDLMDGPMGLHNRADPSEEVSSSRSTVSRYPLRDRVVPPERLYCVTNRGV